MGRNRRGETDHTTNDIATESIGSALRPLDLVFSGKANALPKISHDSGKRNMVDSLQQCSIVKVVWAFSLYSMAYQAFRTLALEGAVLPPILKLSAALRLVFCLRVAWQSWM